MLLVKKARLPLMLGSILYGACVPQVFSQDIAALDEVGVNDPESFSIVLIPDTQNYAEKAPELYAHQTQWVVDNSAERNVKFVMHLGDITQHDTVEQWEGASAAHAILDAADIPYSMVSGNHDLYPSSEIYARESYFSQYFGLDRFEDRPWFGGSFDKSGENNYSTFEAAGQKFLLMNLEFIPRKDVATWANRIISEHPDHRVIVATHCYQSYNGNHTTGWASRYNIEGREGDDLWEEVVQRHSNVFMTVSGHIHGSSYRMRTGNNGNSVHEILTDFQSEPLMGDGTAMGNGWIRVLTFNPNNEEIVVETLSVEEGNYEVFPDGEAVLFDNYNRIANPTPEMHNLIDYTIGYDLRDQQRYAYTVDDIQYKDRHPHTTLRGRHAAPRIATADNGTTVTVWQEDRAGNGLHGIYARAFDVDGNALFPEILVSESTTTEQRSPSVATDDEGNFVVAWESQDGDDGQFRIHAAGFRANGEARFPDHAVGAQVRNDAEPNGDKWLSAGNGNGEQRNAAVAMDRKGRFVVTWEDDSDGDGSFDIAAQGFLVNGVPQYARILVNEPDTAGAHQRPTIAMTPHGDYVVGWDNEGASRLLARGFDAEGKERFAQMTVNATTTGQQGLPAVGMADSGRFVVTWQDDKDGNGYYQILARGFMPDGQEVIPEFTVNTKGAGQQLAPGIGMSPDGNFTVAFEDDNDGNGYYQVYARIFNADGSQRRGTFTVNSDASGQQFKPVVALDAQNRTVVAWEDDMDGDGEFGVLQRNFTFPDAD